MPRTWAMPTYSRMYMINDRDRRLCTRSFALHFCFPFCTLLPRKARKPFAQAHTRMPALPSFFFGMICFNLQISFFVCLCFVPSRPRGRCRQRVGHMQTKSSFRFIDEFQMIFFVHPTPFCLLPATNNYQNIRPGRGIDAHAKSETMGRTVALDGQMRSCKIRLVSFHLLNMTATVCCISDVNPELI